MSYTINSLDTKNHNHKNSLIDLWKKYLNKYFDARFEWLYKDNPAGQTKTVLAFKDDENKIIGCGSICPRPLYLNGQKARAGIAVDFIVDENHRTYGPALKLQRANFSEDNSSEFDIIIAFPNQAAKGPFLRVGCKALGEASLFTKVLKSENKIARYINIPVLTKSIGFILDQLLRLFDKMRVFAKPSNWHAETVDAFDERFDAFWNEVRNYKIIAERSSDYLNWRYARCKGIQYKVFCLSEKGSKTLKGYIVYFLHNNVANIEDMFAVNMDRTWLYLLYEFSEHMRKEGVVSICFSYFGNALFKELFHKLNFFEKKETRTVLLYINSNSSESFRNMALNPNNWSLFEGDLDL